MFTPVTVPPKVNVSFVTSPVGYTLLAACGIVLSIVICLGMACETNNVTVKCEGQPNVECESCFLVNNEARMVYCYCDGYRGGFSTGKCTFWGRGK